MRSPICPSASASLLRVLLKHAHLGAHLLMLAVLCAVAGTRGDQ
jgi:hypothetical protein